MEFFIQNPETLVNQVVAKKNRRLTNEELENRFGLTSDQVFAITEASRCGLKPSQIATKLDQLKTGMDGIEIAEIMGITEKMGIKDPKFTRRKLYFTARFLKEIKSGQHPNPTFDPDEAARNTDW